MLRPLSFFKKLPVFLLVYLSLNTVTAQVYTSSISAGSGGTGRAAVEPGDALLLNPASLPHLKGRFIFTSFAEDEFAASLSDNTQESALPAGFSYVQKKSSSSLGDLKNHDLSVTLAELVGTLELDARQGMADVLNPANSLAPQLADVNVRIKDATVPGVSYPSGDLLDERDRITSKLQELIGGTTTINEDGTASYSVDGVQLVDRVRSNRFSLESGSATLTPDDSLPLKLYMMVPRSEEHTSELQSH